MVRPESSIGLISPLHFFCCDINFLVRSKVVWNTRTGAKVSIDVMVKEGKSIYRIYKLLLAAASMMEGVNVTNLPLGG